MTRPNFFIVGAPKSGTTSLHEYLSAHPQVFVPRLKEPHYFARDLRIGGSHRHLEWYLGLFSDSAANHSARGEASVFYLYSDVAIQLIHDFEPEAKIIVMLRNPIDLVYSLHGQLLYTGHETERSFEKAWHLQAARKRSPPADIQEPRLLHYSDVASLGLQVERLFRVFPRSQVLPILFDDFRDSPHRSYEMVLDFLGLARDNRNEFPARNPGMQPRQFWPFKKKGPGFRRQIKSTVIRIFGEDTGRRVVLSMTKTVRKKRPPMPEPVRSELVEHFSSDVARLSDALGVRVPW